MFGGIISIEINYYEFVDNLEKYWGNKMKSKRGNTIIITLLVISIVILYSLIFDKLLFLNGMQFTQLTSYPKDSMIVFSVNTICGIAIYLIGLHISEKKEILKKIVILLGILTTTISGVTALIMLFLYFC